MQTRHTKIIATIGPASDGPERIAALIDAGVDVIRVNTSHLSPEGALEAYEQIEAVRTTGIRDVAILADLQGPKLRLGVFAPNRPVRIEDRVRFIEGSTSEDERVPININGITELVEPGMVVRLGDGTPEFRIDSVDSQGTMHAVCIAGGALRSRMGIMFPTGTLHMPALTDADVEHVRVAAPYADFMALSFVGDANDVGLLRNALHTYDSSARIIAKIERQEALDHLDAITEASDGLMVARGDLGVELGLAHVPFAQRRILEAAQQNLKCVITATQVLESMIHADIPTRAEVTDIAVAVERHTSALMLSAETATGTHPLTVVEQMAATIHAVEGYIPSSTRDQAFDDPRASLVRAADQLARGLGVEKMIVPTSSGDTARFAAALARPTVLALADSAQVRRQLLLERGVVPLAWDGDHGESLPIVAARWALQAGWIQPNEQVVVAWGEFKNGAISQLVASVNIDG
jgi:pyruvate kinase